VNAAFRINVRRAEIRAAEIDGADKTIRGLGHVSVPGAVAMGSMLKLIPDPVATAPGSDTLSAAAAVHIEANCRDQHPAFDDVLRPVLDV